MEQQQTKMIMVEARFTCNSNFPPSTSMSGNDIYMNAVYGEENKSWAEATPFGQIRMWVNGDAAKQFVQGKTYKVTFEEVVE